MTRIRNSIIIALIVLVSSTSSHGCQQETSSSCSSGGKRCNPLIPISAVLGGTCLIIVGIFAVYGRGGKWPFDEADGWPGSF